jgi:hypothetical protein
VSLATALVGLHPAGETLFSEEGVRVGVLTCVVAVAEDVCSTDVGELEYYAGTALLYYQSCWLRGVLDWRGDVSVDYRQKS